MPVDLKHVIAEILEKSEVMSLATYDGEVWVSDLNYVSDDSYSKLYWISDRNSRHSLAITTEPKVAATVSLARNAVKNQRIGLQIGGIASVTRAPSDEIIDRYRKRGNPADIPYGKAKMPEHNWYMLIPYRIEITHEPLFGMWKKKAIVIDGSQETMQ